MDYGVLDDGHDVQVGIGDQVGNVAVDEDFTSIETHDLVRRDTTVRASDVALKLSVFFGRSSLANASSSFWNMKGTQR